MEKIAIVGLGLIGGSLGLALKRAKLEGVEIFGHDKEPTVNGKAAKKGAVDRTHWNLIQAVEGASLVILATPVEAIKEVMGQIAPYLPEGCVVTDTGSTKESIMNAAKEALPSHVSFVGGHPMAGKETPGIDSAEDSLFENKTYCLFPAPTATPQAVKSIVSMVELIGAKPFFVDAAEHDSYVAAVSHLPVILSAALVSSTNRHPSWREMARLAATGYRDLTRLASGDPEMNRDICLTNKEGIIRWIDNYIDELGLYRNLIAEGGKELEENFVKVLVAREKWLKGDIDEDKGRSGAFAEIPSAGERMAGLFLGDRLARRGREMMQGADKGPQKR